MKRDSLGDRMKNYESIPKKKLISKLPVIIRCDGRAFHTFTKGLKKPFDDILIETMIETTQEMMKEIPNAKFAYTQSDEISILLIDYEKNETEPWFDNEVDKMTSVSAGIATKHFNRIFFYKVQDFKPTTEEDNKYKEILLKKIFKADFDSRVFNLPMHEVVNCFIWRQQDATRNSIQMVGQSNFKQKELEKKSCNEIQEMLFSLKSINFNNIETHKKRGTSIYKVEVDGKNSWKIDKEIPVFSQNKEFVEKFVNKL